MSVRDLSRWDFPPPTDWAEFERLCRQLWSRISGNYDVQLNGSRGQSQNGVDIWGRNAAGYFGVQCKRKSQHEVASRMTIKALEAAVEDAKQFRPELAEFVVAYSGKRDAKLQEAARLITERHQAVGLFKVTICSWEEITELLGQFRDIAEAYSPQLAGPVFDEVAVKAATSSVALTEHLAVLVTIDKLLREYKLDDALHLLQSLRGRIEASFDRELKFRFYSTLAKAHQRLGEHVKSGEAQLESSRYAPNELEALSKQAQGYLAQTNVDKALVLAQELLVRDPWNPDALSVLIRSAAVQGRVFSESIPEEALRKEKVAYALAISGCLRGEFVEGLGWYRQVLGAPGGEFKSNPEFVAEYCSARIKALFARHDFVPGPDCKQKDRDELLDTKKLMSQIVDPLIASGAIVHRLSWLQLRSQASHLMGDFDNALHDLETALRFAPGQPELLRAKAVMCMQAGNREVALSILESIAGKPEVPEAALFLGNLLLEVGRSDEARVWLEKILATNPGAELRIAAVTSLLRMALAAEDPNWARELLRALKEAGATPVAQQAWQARVERSAGNLSEATALLQKAAQEITDNIDVPTLIFLADGCLNAELFHEACMLYESLLSPASSSKSLGSLLYCYYRTNQIEKAMQLCSAFPMEKKDADWIRLEIRILLDQDDLPSAENIVRLYLETHSDDTEIKAQLAALCFRQDKLSEVDSLLSHLSIDSTLSLDTGLKVVQLCAERAHFAQAINLAYELRRHYFDQAAAHANYLNLIFRYGDRLEEILKAPLTVTVGAAVAVKNNANVVRWYVLDPRPAPSVALEELAPSGELFKKLLGCVIGDTITLNPESPFADPKTVEAIDSKFEYAKARSMELMPEHFSEAQFMVRVPLNDDSPEEFLASLEKVLALSDRKDYIDRVVETRKAHPVPVGLFAMALAKNPIDVINVCLDSDDAFKSNLGTQEERDGAFKALSTTETIVLDLSGLILAGRIGFLDWLPRLFKRVLVAQSTVDCLQESISENRQKATKGQKSVGKHADQIITIEREAAEFAEYGRSLDALKSWIREHAEVAPTGWVLPQNERQEYEEMIGKPFLDTVLVAKQTGGLLYSDDYPTRCFAQWMLEVPSVWSQAVALWAHSQKHLSESEYCAICQKLLAVNYDHVCISSAVLLYAVKEEHWKVGPMFLGILDTFKSDRTELKSTFKVVSEFIYRLFLQDPLPHEKDSLVVACLNALSEGRDDNSVLQQFLPILGNRFRLNPLGAREVIEIVTRWQESRLQKVRFALGG